METFRNVMDFCFFLRNSNIIQHHDHMLRRNLFAFASLGLYSKLVSSVNVSSAKLKELHRPCCGQNASNCVINVQCPYHEHSGDEDMVCVDGYKRNPYTESNGWSMCVSHGGRHQCPSTHRYLCAREKQCAGKKEHCCSPNCWNGDGVRACSGFETPVIAPQEATTVIDLSLYSSTPWLEVNQKEGWIQCKDDELISIESLFAVDRVACTNNSIAVCPVDRPVLAKAYDYNTSLPIYRGANHCTKNSAPVRRIIYGSA